MSKLNDEDKIYIALISLDKQDIYKIYGENEIKKIVGEYYTGYDYYEDNNGMYMYFVSKENVLSKAKELFDGKWKMGRSCFPFFNICIKKIVFFDLKYYYKI